MYAAKPVLAVDTVLPGCTSNTPSESTLIVDPSGAVADSTMLAPATDTVTFLSVLVMRASVFSPSTKTMILFEGELAMADAIDFVSPRMISSVLLSIVVVVVVADDEEGDAVEVVVGDGTTTDIGAVVVVDGDRAAIGAGSATGAEGAIVGIAFCD